MVVGECLPAVVWLPCDEGGLDVRAGMLLRVLDMKNYLHLVPF